MRAIKIDSEKQEVSVIDIKPELPYVYKAIGNGCTNVEFLVKQKNQDFIMVDENLLQRPKDIKGAFHYRYMGGRPIVGNAIVLGMDEDGNWTDSVSTVEQIENNLMF